MANSKHIPACRGPKRLTWRAKGLRLPTACLQGRFEDRTHSQHGAAAVCSESVFLSFNSDFSTAVITAQQDCIRSRNEESCTKRSVNLAADVLAGAVAYNASLAPATGTAPGPPPGGSFQVSESNWARTENLAALPGQEHADQGFSAAESELPALRIDPSKLGQAGTATDGQPNWFIQPCASPEACSSAFTALGRLHVVVQPSLGHDVLTQPLAAPPA